MFTSGLVDSPQVEQNNQLKLRNMVRQVLGRCGFLFFYARYLFINKLYIVCACVCMCVRVHVCVCVHVCVTRIDLKSGLH